MVTLGPGMKRPGGPGEPTLPGAPGSPWRQWEQKVFQFFTDALSLFSVQKHKTTV